MYDAIALYLVYTVVIHFHASNRYLAKMSLWRESSKSELMIFMKCQESCRIVQRRQHTAHDRHTTGGLIKANSLTQVTDKIFEYTKSISEIKSAEDFPEIDIDTVGQTEVKGADGKTVTVEVLEAMRERACVCARAHTIHADRSHRFSIALRTTSVC